MSDFLLMLPEPDNVDRDRLRNVSDRLLSWFSANFPDLDLEPGGVLYEIYIRPMAYLITAVETGSECLESSYNMEEVLSGNFCSCETVSAWLETFGLLLPLQASSYGFVRLFFTQNGHYTLDASVLFNSGSRRFRPVTTTTIKPYGAMVQSGDVLLSYDPEEELFWVDIPVIGTKLESTIVKGTVIQTDLILEQLLRVEIGSDIVSVSYPTELKEFVKVLRTVSFPSGFFSAAGIQSFLRTRVPSLYSSWVSVGTDPEMQRIPENMFGVKTSGIDVWVHGALYWEEFNVILAGSPDAGPWKGALEFSGIPLLLEVFNESTKLTDWELVATQKANGVPGGVSLFGTNEIQYGLIVSDQTLESSDIYTNFDPNTPHPFSNTQQAGLNLFLSDSFSGHPFVAALPVSLKFLVTEFVAEDHDMRVRVFNLLTGECTDTTWVANGTFSWFYERDSSFLFNKWFAGYDLAGFEINGEGPIANQSEITIDVIPPTVQLSVKALCAKTPALCESIYRNENQDNLDIIFRAPYLLRITELHLTYTVSKGAWFDAATAKTAITALINQSAYPTNISLQEIAVEMHANGAKTVNNVRIVGTLSTTPATKWSPTGDDSEENLNAVSNVTGADATSYVGYMDVDTDIADLDKTLLIDLIHNQYISPRNTMLYIETSAFKFVQKSS